MPTIQQALCEPNVGADLTRVQAFLDYLATKLAAEDYTTATNLLWAAVDPVYAARLNREAA
jgi:hypothetical protein